mmetsp:Transcript_27983/g.73801  ORF Transcript_27983/g.73801 Transcript_27983/m.73801 type:complete len:201 (-) Transcript_27983:148-750(-)
MPARICCSMSGAPDRETTRAWVQRFTSMAFASAKRTSPPAMVAQNRWRGDASASGGRRRTMKGLNLVQNSTDRMSPRASIKHVMHLQHSATESGKDEAESNKLNFPPSSLLNLSTNVSRCFVTASVVAPSTRPRGPGKDSKSDTQLLRCSSKILLVLLTRGSRPARKRLPPKPKAVTAQGFRRDVPKAALFCPALVVRAY